MMSPNPPRVTAVTGTVKFKRINEAWRPVSTTTQLRQDHLLIRASNSSVTIICGNGNPGASFRANTPVGFSSICPSGTPVSDVINSAIPDIISPRSTQILNKQPTLRWYAAINAHNFKVTVRGQGLSWTTQVSREEACQGDICELVYPGDQPLQPEVSYKLVVETTDTNRSSEEITAPGLGFKLIDESKAQQVKEKTQRIQEENLSGQELALKLADLYVDFNLLAEAIATLEALPNEDKNAAVYYQLGELYHWIRLPLKAKAYYEEAVAKAEVALNKSELAAAQVGLGEANWTLGRKDEARIFLEAAKATYTELGDTDMVSYLEERLREIAANE
jgi:hypothetical protein